MTKDPIAARSAPDPLEILVQVGKELDPQLGDALIRDVYQAESEGLHGDVARAQVRATVRLRIEQEVTANQ
jgi:hypothetical protein